MKEIARSFKVVRCAPFLSPSDDLSQFPHLSPQWAPKLLFVVVGASADIIITSITSSDLKEEVLVVPTVV